MSNNLDKSISIITVLMLYCHKLGSTTSYVVMDLQPDMSHYKIRAPIAYVEPDELERLRHYLNQPRDRMIEESYWMLGSRSDGTEQLRLLGMMVDEAEVTFENSELYICVRRVNRT
jgi:hypothetical protein